MAKKQFFEQRELVSKIKDAFLIPGSPFTKTDVDVETGTGIVPAGTVLALKTSTKKVVEYKQTGSDGENVARYILATDQLDFATDKKTMVYDMGTFIMDGLNFPTDLSATEKETMKKDLESHKLYLRRIKE